VREFLRGEDAIKVINTADWQADPLPEGQEYALARVFIRNTSLDENSRYYRLIKHTRVRKPR